MTIPLEYLIMALAALVAGFAIAMLFATGKIKSLSIDKKNKIVSIGSGQEKKGICGNCISKGAISIYLERAPSLALQKDFQLIELFLTSKRAADHIIIIERTISETLSSIVNCGKIFNLMERYLPVFQIKLLEIICQSARMVGTGSNSGEDEVTNSLKKDITRSIRFYIMQIKLRIKDHYDENDMEKIELKCSETTVEQAFEASYRKFSEALVGEVSVNLKKWSGLGSSMEELRTMLHIPDY
jgi:hypothetical protein